MIDAGTVVLAPAPIIGVRRRLETERHRRYLVIDLLISGATPTWVEIERLPFPTTADETPDAQARLWGLLALNPTEPEFFPGLAAVARASNITSRLAALERWREWRRLLVLVGLHHDPLGWSSPPT